MKKRLVVTVTRQDIKKGRPGMCDKCPVALALLRATNAFRVTIGDTMDEPLFWVKDGAKWTHPMYTSICTFVDNFDDDKPVQPFAFTLFLSKVTRDN